ncbi:MAG: ASCH domain-containing protein [DPANN group archaeon]|nr:ASCH domain-containing protein [DPANN group archaeon]
MDGLIIKAKWLNKIFEGKKTWEIRGCNTNKRGKIALIQSGSGKIVGICEIIEVLPVLSTIDLEDNIEKHCITKEDIKEINYEKKYAWVIKNAIKLTNPILYRHPKGAVIWVKL